MGAWGWIIGALLVAALVLWVVAMFVFVDQCKSDGGHVVTTFLYFQTIVGANGSVTLLPVYDYQCVVP